MGGSEPGPTFRFLSDPSLPHDPPPPCLRFDRGPVPLKFCLDPRCPSDLGAFSSLSSDRSTGALYGTDPDPSADVHWIDSSRGPRKTGVDMTLKGGTLIQLQ